MTLPEPIAAPMVVLPADASQELDQLGLTVELLHRALAAGETGAGNITKFHPVGAAGSIRWIDTVGQLRQELTNEYSWKAVDPKNSPRIVNPERTMAIMVVAGDEDTGNEAPIHPGTARPRGAATDDAVYSNQLSLFELPREVEVERKVRSGDIPTWVLLYFRSDDPSEIRAELSFPTDIIDGEISRWQKRIILEPVAIEAAEVQPKDAGGTADVSFDVQPRQ